MLNTALANVLLLVAELCFWYQLSNLHQEWAERPVGERNSQTNITGGHSTGVKMQQLVMPAGQFALPRTQNASHMRLAHFPLPSIVPLVPLLLLWLQSFLFVNYSYIRKIDSTVTIILY